MKKVFRIVLLLIFAGVILGTFYLLWRKSRPQSTRYELLKVDTVSFENISVATGKVSPRDEVLIKPQISGIISELKKEAGDHVRAGDVLATVKVIPEMSSLNAAESRVRIAEIDLRQVESEYGRQKQLYDKGVISRDEMDKSEADYAKAREELDNARDNLDIVKEGISKKMAQLSNTQIRSTIDGMVLDVPVKVGNSVIQANTFNDGTTIATVADMNDLIFIGKIDETEVGRIRVGMPIKLTIGALEGQTFDASLEYISPQGVEENGAILFEIKAAVNLPDSVEVRAGYSANAQIVLERADGVLGVPESAVQFTGDSTFVYVLKDSLGGVQHFEKRVVQIGLSNGIQVEVTEGLTQGEQVRGNAMTETKKGKS